MDDQYRVPVTRCGAEMIRRFVDEFFLAVGAPHEEAAILADGITTAALRGHPGQGQGIEKVLRYYRAVQLGGIVPNANMRWVKEGLSFAILDAGKGFGYVAGVRAMEAAVKRARETGVAFVSVRNSTHFGIAGYHATRATAAGLIGIAITNAQAEVAPWGAVTPALGTNPWGIAIPNSCGPPVVLDMALATSGKGMIGWLMREGSSIPENWALKPDGGRSTRPEEVLDGPLLPMGDYKGAGLSFMTDVLAGVLSGSKFGLSVTQDAQANDVGHLMIAIYPEAFLPRASFQERLQTLMREVKSAKAMPGQTVLLPGELEARREVERLQQGVPVAKTTIEDLRLAASEVGVRFPF